FSMGLEGRRRENEDPVTDADDERGLARVTESRAPRGGRNYRRRIARHGLPTATQLAGRSLVTTLPAPTTVFSPMLTPGQTIAPPPSQTPSPMMMGSADSKPARRWAASSGCVAVYR